MLQMGKSAHGCKKRIEKKGEQKDEYQSGRTHKDWKLDSFQMSPSLEKHASEYNEKAGYAQKVTNNIL